MAVKACSFWTGSCEEIVAQAIVWRLMSRAVTEGGIAVGKRVALGQSGGRAYKEAKSRQWERQERRHGRVPGCAVSQCSKTNGRRANCCSRLKVRRSRHWPPRALQLPSSMGRLRSMNAAQSGSVGERVTSRVS